MALTDDEQSRLERIVRMMQCDDPALARALATGRFRNRRMFRIGTATAVLAAVSLFLTLWLAQGLLILAAWMLFALGMLLRTLAD